MTRNRPVDAFGTFLIALVWWANPAISGEPQYLLFQIFNGGPDPVSGVITAGRQKAHYEAAADRVLAAAGRPAQGTDRHVGISIGPIAMDQSENELRTTIRNVFDVALSKNISVALHLDDYMFWKGATGADGRLLHEDSANIEWTDWQGTPAEPLNIGWLSNKNLAPQMCYESPEIQQFVNNWSREIIGDEVRKQLDRLEHQGRSELFAGIIAGWESNLAYGYCSLTQLGYSAENPPQDFDMARESILQRHIERVAIGLHDAGIDGELIYSHIAPIPQEDFDNISATNTPEEIREIHQSTAFRAFWTAFNSVGNPGFSGYAGGGRYDDIYAALEEYGDRPWAMAEGTNVLLSAGTHTGGGAESPFDWEDYLAKSFNHGARIVNLFGGFMGVDAGVYSRSTESAEAVAAYKKFLSGASLIEDDLTPLGDFNRDGVCDNRDIDLLSQAIRNANADSQFDLNADGAVTSDDHTFIVTDIKNTWFGDANLDNEFNSSDLVQVLIAGKYENGELSGWAEGDWDGDGLFATGDLVLALSTGGYEIGPRLVRAAVPEPTGLVLMLLACSALVRLRS